MVGRSLGMTPSLHARPKAGGLPVPFACEDDDGTLDHSAVVKRRAIRCALSRICGICGETLTRPIGLLGPLAEWKAGLFTFPPAHHACASEALELFVPLGGNHLGQAEPPQHWVLVTTGGFDLVRPTQHGGIVHFRANSVVDVLEID